MLKFEILEKLAESIGEHPVLGTIAFVIFIAFVVYCFFHPSIFDIFD